MAFDGDRVGALAASPDFGKGQGASLICLQTRGDVASTLRASAGAGDVDTDENVICIADDTANAAVDEDMVGTLKCAGGVPAVTVRSSGRYAPATTRESARTMS